MRKIYRDAIIGGIVGGVGVTIMRARLLECATCPQDYEAYDAVSVADDDVGAVKGFLASVCFGEV